MSVLEAFEFELFAPQSGEEGAEDNAGNEADIEIPRLAGGERTSISMSAEGPVKLRLCTGMISKDWAPILKVSSQVRAIMIPTPLAPSHSR